MNRYELQPSSKITSSSSKLVENSFNKQSFTNTRNTLQTHATMNSKVSLIDETKNTSKDVTRH